MNPMIAHLISRQNSSHKIHRETPPFREMLRPFPRPFPLLPIV